jgi:hypothetical protein
MTSTCFLQSKRNSNGFSWLTRTCFWMPAKGFERYRSWRIEYRISDSGAPSSRSKWKQSRLWHMINHFIEKISARSDQTGPAHIFIDQMIVVSLAVNDIFKMFNQISEDWPNVCECRIVPDFCHRLQPSETICPLPCAQAFWSVRSCKCSGLTNQVGDESIQALYRSCMPSLCSYWKISIRMKNDPDQYPWHNRIFSWRQLHRPLSMK